MKKDIPVIFLVCFVFLCVSVYFFYQTQNKTDDTEVAISEDFSDSGKKESETLDLSGQQDKECAVYLSGAVKNPGLYRYTGVARISDAVEALGGFTANAAKDSVNLAEVLTDGEQIIILTKKQVKKKEKEAKKTETEVQSSTRYEGERIDINQATKEELMTLPGIGEAKALLIVNYRTEHGSFSKPEELMQISGIKEGIYQKIKDFIKT